MMLPLAIDQLAQQFDAPGVEALVLVGSYARGDAGPFSDLDLVRFIADHPPPPGDGSHLHNGQLINVSNIDSAEVAEWFSRPEVAVDVIAGVRQARCLIDRDNYFGTVQAQAQAFAWDATLQARANQWASHQMVGWIEEVHKGLEGLRRNDPGRLLHARHGCSWGLTRVMQVQRGVLISGDNGLYTEVAQAIGIDTEWAHLQRLAFGVASTTGETPSLHEQVQAGLHLYVVTSTLLAGTLQERDVPLIEHTVAVIEHYVD